MHVLISLIVENVPELEKFGATYSYGSLLMAEASVRLVRASPRLFGWMDCVQMTLGSNGKTVEAEQRSAKDRKDCRVLVNV